MCHSGLFQFRVMPFGLVNAPGVFQQLISIVLGGLEGFFIAYTVHDGRNQVFGICHK